MSRPLSVLIVEDEAPAVDKLRRYLNKVNPEIVVAGTCDAVATAAQWLDEKQDTVDLILMDIQLTDGISFEIFKKTVVRKPVIFITAYNEYALEAFKANGIGYLLKPVTLPDLTASLEKFESLRKQFALSGERLEQVKALASPPAAKTYKNRFMVKVGEHIRSITADQILLFYADGRDVYLVTQAQRKFIIDFTLEMLEDVLEPSIFFRVNRTYILNIHCISDVLMYSNSRLKISTQPAWDKEIIVSREKVADFKGWFDGK
jgi:DNA-binding LytR/AlgR family response regulator